VQAIAITSYQGGHIEFFKYLHDLLKEKNAPHIRIFGGGGGTILPSEIKELENYGISRIYSPDDGRKMGLQGMINDLLEKSDFPTVSTPYKFSKEKIQIKDVGELAKLISLFENQPEEAGKIKEEISKLNNNKTAPVLGVTGTGGAGKSSLTDEFIQRFLRDFPDKTIGIVCIDPSKRKTGGALLGDRIRMNTVYHPNIYMRSLATRQTHLAVSKNIRDVTDLFKAAGFDLIIIETSGIGQSDTEVTDYSDISLYVMTSEYGASSQLEKIDMLDFADIVAINKFDKKGSEDALRDVRKQYRRNKQLWDIKDEDLPVFGTVASQFNDEGMNAFYYKTLEIISGKSKAGFGKSSHQLLSTKKRTIIPSERSRYLAEIAEANEEYKKITRSQSEISSALYKLKGSIELTGENEALRKKINELQSQLLPETKLLLEKWELINLNYRKEKIKYKVREKEIEGNLFFKSISQLNIPKIALPNLREWGDIVKWMRNENVPGEFPYTSGVFPLKRMEEDPAKMFAGEGGPEKTNKRFHYLSLGQKAKRLSTAFDSVTLYGEDPDYRPDIYGKVGNSGVSISTLDDAKKLYSGFNLCDPSTSVSMTINGPAPMILAFFMNAAIDQQCEIYIRQNGKDKEVKNKISEYLKSAPLLAYHHSLPEGNNGLGLMLLGVTGDQVLPKEVYEKIKADTLSIVRGTVQADILKEDQAQNTCIFSTEFALKMMGDIQEYFIQQRVKNFYSVSISGYHIAEAGANPITQLAFTLANGFTYVEYYLSRGMHIDDFAPNFSFFFSNGLDPEYTVIGRVARRIWAKAIRNIYKGNERSQKLKYHIQTSGRSLHSQEIAFNDIRTTLQALYAIYDNFNSLHTNAYDEAITTPTEESVRRALAIQLIINKESGLAKNENPIQGAYIIEELSELVEEAVMAEFKRISERGGVTGAMETMYQRSKIQEESMYYEHLKHSGELPLIGVNTFLDPAGSPIIIPETVIRSTKEEKEAVIHSLNNFKKRNKERSEAALENLKKSALENKNIFENLMEASRVCSLGQMTHALYEVGGSYRRNM
jgi:methylmalonyl-CoA mutase